MGTSESKKIPNEVLLPDLLKPVTLQCDDSVDYGTRVGFLALFEEIVSILENDVNEKGFQMPKEATEYLTKMMRYNIPKGKLTRGMTVINTFKVMKPEASRSELKRVAVLGWCIEFIQAAFLVADDIMDDSITRRGQSCWYKCEDVGMIALNDAFVLLIQTEILLHKFFNQDLGMFVSLHSLLVTTIYQTEMGQNLDLSTQPPNKNRINLDLYTEERYDKIVMYKTAFYSFYAPIALGVIAAGKGNAMMLKKTENICLKMGKYFQVQDDVLDVYGDPKVLGKIGTDIKDAKCSWLIVQALKNASDEQRKTLFENYGKDTEESESKVKEVFDQLQLRKQFQSFEETVHKELEADIQQNQNVLPSIILTTLLSKIYKRDK